MLRPLPTAPCSTLLLLLLLLAACNDAPAPRPSAFEAGGVSRADSSGYYRIGGSGPVLLLGVAYAGGLGEAELRGRLDALEGAGGNYLKYFPPARGSQLATLLRLTDERGIVLEVVPRPADRLPATYGHLIVSPVADGPLARANVAVDVAQFNGMIMDGLPAVAINGFGERQFNAVRAARSVGRQLNTLLLRPAAHILPFADAQRARAVTDPRGNYAIYLPGQGAVTVRLDGRQHRRRVTVVGHLGTRRSEVLEPPYDPEFTLESREPRGGWMLITRMD